MKHLRTFALTMGIVASSGSQADVVIKEVHDNIGGTLYGGMTGLLLGGLAGGPIGALAGAALGGLAGPHAQDATGLSQRAYLIETDKGEHIVVRSPTREFTPGQKVQQTSGRLLAEK